MSETDTDSSFLYGRVPKFRRLALAVDLADPALAKSSSVVGKW